MPRGPIVLATDFGWSTYVGQMKGIISGIAPEARVIDLTHEITPQDILEGIWHLRAALPYFPKGSIFLAVVDPGVGTERRALCVDAGDIMAVGPDNGLLSFIPEERRRGFYLIESPDYVLPKQSSVFHGRDIFAPAAAHLALGLDPAKLGPQAEGMVELPWSLPRLIGEGIEGAVHVVDRFGNLLTNLEGSWVPQQALISVASTPVGHLQRKYSDVEPGRLLALIGSSGYLEIAIRNGSAAKALNVGKGAKVLVKGAK